MWMDPDNNLFVLLLTNSVHPSAVSELSPSGRWI